MADSSFADAGDRLLRARIQLALQQPFLASALMRLPFRECDCVSWCQTMATDGYHIFYSPHWVMGLADAEIRGVIAHEVLHVVFAHADRSGDRHPGRWNLACDFAINLLLSEQGFTLPAGGALDRRYAGLPAEEIYGRLAASDSKQASVVGKHVPGPADRDVPGVVIDVGADLVAPDDARVAAMRDIDMPDKEQLAELVATLRHDAGAKLHGRAAAYFKQDIDAASSAQVDWVALLRQWLQDRIKSDWSSYPFSKRYIHRGIYLPSPSVHSPGHVVFAIDTSGSMSDVALAEILAEVRAYRESFPCRLTVIQADAAIQSVVTYEELDGLDVPKKMAIVGRGGTDFRPVFDWIREQVESAITVLIYATDGYGTFPAREPLWPTIWLVTRGGVQSRGIPFGACVRLR